LINKSIDSQAGIDPSTSSRSGIKTLTKTIALQLADKEIRVNAIAPGIIETEIHKDIEDKQKIDKKTKIKSFHLIEWEPQMR
jgi:3-oxoacyl-[acyl-carrier protein] reductase